MELNDKLLLLDFEKYLEKKRRKIGNTSHGFDRGQHELITQIVLTEEQDGIFIKKLIL
ncbi:MAG: hypothetical protein WB975_01385 [Nitrososphaeraceae archaeon]